MQDNENFYPDSPSPKETFSTPNFSESDGAAQAVEQVAEQAAEQAVEQGVELGEEHNLASADVGFSAPNETIPQADTGEHDLKNASPQPTQKSVSSNASRFTGRFGVPERLVSKPPVSAKPAQTDKHDAGHEAPDTASAGTNTASAGKVSVKATRPYLHGLDGLRAIAVALVLVYHFLPQYVPGGNNGVDVFFVLSGFLITSLLIAEKESTGQVSLGQFWLRRVRRLVPAVMTMLLVTASFAALIGGDVLVGIRRQFLSAMLWVANWAEIVSGGNYFDQGSPHLYTNMWSLAVEEQFYLVWPILLVLLIVKICPRPLSDEKARKLLALITAGIGALSVAWAALDVYLGAPASRVYYGTDTHCYGLMFGSALALWDGRALLADNSRPRLSRLHVQLRGLLSWLGLAGVIGVAGTVGDQNPLMTPWGLALSSIFALMIVQALVPQVYERVGLGRLLAKILDFAPLRWIGKRSYGIYLWHWPLYVLAFYLFPLYVGTFWTSLLLAVVSITLAHLSFTYLETPIRRLGFIAFFKSLSKARLLAAAGALAVTLALTSTGFYHAPAITSAQQYIENGTASQDESSSATDTRKPGKDNALADGLSATPNQLSVQANKRLKADHGKGEEEIDPEEEKEYVAPPQPRLPLLPKPPKPRLKPLVAGEAGAGDKVLVLGDSVTLASEKALLEMLPGVAVDGKVSRHMSASLELLQQMDAQYGPRKYVVVGLATNGPVKIEQLNELLQAIGPKRKLILVDAFTPPRVTWTENNNALLTQFVAEHKGQVTLAHWYDYITPHQDLLARDLIHPGPAGGKLYAQAVLDAINSLR